MEIELTEHKYLVLSIGYPFIYSLKTFNIGMQSVLRIIYKYNEPQFIASGVDKYFKYRSNGKYLELSDLSKLVKILLGDEYDICPRRNKKFSTHIYISKNENIRKVVYLEQFEPFGLGD